MGILQVRALAEEYALKYNPEHVSPFPYENVLKEYDNLKIYFTVLEDNVSGAILFKDDEYNILINTSKPATRQNFTLGHELGHYFLHQQELKDDKAIIDGDETLDGPKILYRRDSEEDNKRLEIEANNFAASLLMPTDLVRRAWQATQSVEECARIFSVSVLAMSIRLTRLGLLPE
jgi:Zn-dependent peptidase ImmA (M78 family)